MLAAGERTTAHAALQKASEKTARAKDGRVVAAIIERADLLADEGKYDDAIKLHDKALEAAANIRSRCSAARWPRRARHRLGRGAWTTSTSSSTRSSGRGSARTGSSRWRWPTPRSRTTRASTRRCQAATGPTEVRFGARIALAHVLDGDLAAAAKARDDHRLVRQEQGGARSAGRAGRRRAGAGVGAAREGARRRQGRQRARHAAARPSAARSRSRQGRARRARSALAASPENIEVQILREQARALANAGKERTVALDALEKVARKAKTKLGRHALGAALLATGGPGPTPRSASSRRSPSLRRTPNPVAYRTRTLLAEIELAAGNLDAAPSKSRTRPRPTPATCRRARWARLVLAKGDPDPALDLLRPVVKEGLALNEAVELTLGRGAGPPQGRDRQDRIDAVAALERAKAAGASPEEIGRIAFLIDPALPEKLGAPVPTTAANGTSERRAATTASAAAAAVAEGRDGPPTRQGVAGRYRVEAALAAGGMGAIDRAVDVQTGRRVAIKSVLPSWRASRSSSAGSSARPRPRASCATPTSSRSSRSIAWPAAAWRW